MNRSTTQFNAQESEYKQDDLKSRVQWRRRGAKQKDYDFIYYATQDGKVFRIDYSLPRQRVRYSIEKDGQKKWSEIENGKILRSNFLSRKAQDDTSDPIAEHQHIFRTVPERDIIYFSGSNHGFNSLKTAPLANQTKQHRDDSALNSSHIELTRKKYFSQQPNLVKPKKNRKLTYQPLFWHIIQTFLIFTLAMISWNYHLLSPLSAGAIMASLGIVLGGYDLLLKNQDPFLPKVLFLVVSGGYIYLNNYF